ncbi:hypothetical protein C7974DRAFT_224641 [Boeremia exigua]|uniref:uncharacterized protein n=1 Tax=Boeremia exigua TaxID=749465 RepID=UPI001E8DD257|nr:uncharacterized protein C7974DRAFT_224641 [Boeremia exigua]KAH6620019.1 hypothetical protein C7974DRAFT_224641 [Boeremia exigua]
MCWCFNFGFSSKPKYKSPSSNEKRRRDAPADGALHGKGRPVVAEVQEKRRSKDSSRKRRSADAEAPRSSRRSRIEVEAQLQQHYPETHQGYEQQRPALNVQVPAMWQRSVYPGAAYHTESTNSSQETLLNPRPHRSTHQRQRHPKHTSQATLRGRGAKRDPPKKSKSKKSLRPEPSRGWSFFAPSPPKTRSYQTLNAPSRSHRSSRQNRTAQHDTVTTSSPSQSRHHRSRQHDQQAPTTRSARSRTPNTAARRVPDRRFAVLAATNQALETVRRDAFSQPSPPPRRERLRRYEGVTIPTSQMPFNWDCVSSSQASGGRGGSSTRHRRSRR